MNPKTSLSASLVIIGAGQAAAQAVATLRAAEFAGPITVVGDEIYPPYQRPPLSKGFLSGAVERDRLFLKPDTFYSDSNCKLILNNPALSISRDAKTVSLADGQVLSYGRLLLATGARVRKLSIPGADLAGVNYLRSISDATSLAASMRTSKRLAIVGGGYIGLEVAAAAVERGLEVSVFEVASRVMARTVSAPVSHFYETAHRAAGVKLFFNTPVEAFEGREKLEAICAVGQRYPVDIALVGIGAVPNQDLASAAGLDCTDGILVDNQCRTPADDSIYAAGDCTRHVGREGIELRLECVQNAIDQAKHAALAIAGTPQPYSELPWFWSDQYDLKLRIAGICRPTDQVVVHGDPDSRKFAVFHVRDGVLAAVETVNAAPEYVIGRKLIVEGRTLAPGWTDNLGRSINTART